MDILSTLRRNSRSGEKPFTLSLHIYSESCFKKGLGEGLATEFRSEKIPWTRLGMVFVIPRKKVVIPSLMEESIPKLGTERSDMKKLVLQKILLQQTELAACFCRDMLRNGIPRVCFFFCSTEQNSELVSLTGNCLERNSESLPEYLAFFSSAETFEAEFREFSVQRNRRNSAGTNQLFRLFRFSRSNFFVGNCLP